MARRKRTDDELPSLPDLPEVQREAVANWWRSHMEEIEVEHQARVQMLRTVGEHPSPLFAHQVKQMGHLGLDKRLAAKALGISMYTLETYYKEEYDIGAADVIVKIAQNMVRIATSPDDPNNAKVGMAILDRRGGEEWRPPAQKIETTHTKPTERTTIDSSKLTPEERAQLREIIENALEREESPDGDNEGLAGGELVPR